MRYITSLVYSSLVLIVMAVVVGVSLLILTDGVATGLQGKTLWEWGELLLIPLALVVLATLLQLVERKTDREIARERVQQETLQRYLDSMGTLINEKALDSESVVHVMRARTAVTLRTLLPQHNKDLISFLVDSGLAGDMRNCSNRSEIHSMQSLLQQANLSGANLSGANLDFTDLTSTNLSGANLRDAGLSDAHLSGADLSGADLSDADLSGALLDCTDLSHTNLRGVQLNAAWLIGTDLSYADLTGADLRFVRIDGAILCSARLQGCEFLSEFQLCKAVTLYKAELPPRHLEYVKSRCPKLLEEPHEKK